MTTQSLKKTLIYYGIGVICNLRSLKKMIILIGEDSTIYLASETAAKRIAIQNKAIKILFILYHPTKRVISNYLYNLKPVGAIYNLEDTLQ